MDFEAVCKKYKNNKIFYGRGENAGRSLIKFLSEEGIGTLGEQTVIISDNRQLGYDIYWGVRYAYLEKGITEEKFDTENEKIIKQVTKIASEKKDETYHFAIVKEQEEEYKNVLRDILKDYDGKTIFILALDKTEWMEDVLKELEEEYTSKGEDSF